MIGNIVRSKAKMGPGRHGSKAPMVVFPEHTSSSGDRPGGQSSSTFLQTERFAFDVTCHTQNLDTCASTESVNPRLSLESRQTRTHHGQTNVARRVCGQLTQS